MPVSIVNIEDVKAEWDSVRRIRTWSMLGRAPLQKALDELKALRKRDYLAFLRYLELMATAPEWPANSPEVTISPNPWEFAVPRTRLSVFAVQVDSAMVILLRMYLRGESDPERVKEYSKLMARVCFEEYRRGIQDD